MVESNIPIWGMLISLLMVSIPLVSIYIWKSDDKNKMPISFEGKLPLLKISWVDFGLFLFVIFLLTFLSQGIFSNFINNNDDESLNAADVIISIFSLHIPILASVILFQKFYLSDQTLVTIKNDLPFLENLKGSFIIFIQYLPLIWLVSILWNLILSLLEKYSFIEKAPIQPIVELLAKETSNINLLILGLSAIILAPIVEEILFRGCIYRFLKGKINLPNAQIISAIIFALAHSNLSSFIPLVFIGFILAQIYESSGNIIKPILFHALFNACSFIFLILIKNSNFEINSF